MQRTFALPAYIIFGLIIFGLYKMMEKKGQAYTTKFVAGITIFIYILLGFALYWIYFIVN